MSISGYRGAKASQKTRHEILSGADDGYLQFAARHALRGIDLLLERRPFIGDRSGGLSEVPAGVGQMHSPGNHLVERQANRVGDLLQLH